MKLQHARMSVLIVVLSLLATGGAVAQNTGTIVGTVVDSSEGEPLPGVNVRVIGTQLGAAVDRDGNYTIDGVPTGTQSVEASFIGYQKKTRQNVIVRAGETTTVNFTLQTRELGMEEVVVVGYGTQEREDLTGAVSTVSSERLQGKIPNNNFAQALQGSVAGLRVTQTGSSAEGNQMQLLLRGQRSINASNSPLLVVDGLPYEGSISDIVSSDIESISVLKDASATAIYGSRAANGVILIETKQGEGAPSVSYNGSFGVQSAANIPELLNGKEFYEFKKDRIGEGRITASELSVLEEDSTGVDWVDVALQRGQRQEHSLSVSGSGENTTYYISGSVLSVQGIRKGDDFDRFGTRANVETSVTDWFTAGANTQLLFTNGSGLGVQWGGFSGAYTMNPLTTPFQENGSPTIYPWPDDVFFGNPLAPTLAEDTDHTYKIFSNGFVNVNIPFVEGLEYRIDAGVEYTSNKSRTYFGQNTKEGLENQGISSTSESVGENYTVENIVTYERSFGAHSLDLTGLYSFQFQRFNAASIDGQGFVSDKLGAFQYNQADLVEPGTSFGRETLLSQMGRANYEYDDRYFLTLTVRRDGFSGFGDNNKYGVFPSAAVAWNVSNEDFLDVEWLSNLKVRASWGVQGNQAIDPYQTRALLQNAGGGEVYDYLYGEEKVTGYLPGRLANPTLSWESTATTNIGLNLGLWQDRLRLAVDMYNSDTEDLLFNRSIPRTHGFVSIIQNVGQTNNKGIELSLSTVNVQVGEVTWETRATMSRNWNKIVSLIGDEDIVSNRLFIGEPIDVNYDYVFDGIWQQDDDIANSHQPSADPGDVRLKDVNGDGKITPDDRTIQGQQRPKVTWGLQNTLSYGNVSLYVFLQGDHGSKRFQPFSNDAVGSDVRRNTTPKNWWTPENPTNEHWANDPNANPLGIEKLESDSYIRLKDVSLSYTVEERWTREIGLQSVEIYGTARNLVTITDWSGLDPELFGQQATPLTRDFVFGVNLGF